jgi:hypothetical protein
VISIVAQALAPIEGPLRIAGTDLAEHHIGRTFAAI